MKKKLSIGFAMLLIAAMLMTSMPNITYATSSLALEKSHEWVNGDRSYVSAVATGDVDGDDVKEMVTAGFFHDPELVAQPFYAGKIDIWNWNGSLLSQEHEEIFTADLWSNDTRFYAINIGNVDNDTETEIVTAGYLRLLGVRDLGLLIVWNWNGSNFKREALAGWPPAAANAARFYGSTIGDVDDDGVKEIVAVGYINTTSYLGTGLHSAITVWNVTDSTLTLERSIEWGIGLPTICESVSVNDVDGDGDVEIIVGGHYYDSHLYQTNAMLRIYDGKTLTLEKSYQWIIYRRTEIHAIATGDVDLDGVVEIVTAGDHWNGYNTNGQLGIWSWDGDNLILETSREWSIAGYAIVIKTIAIDDVDNDGTPEIITSGFPGQLRFWSWKRDVLTLEKAEMWGDTTDISGTAVNDVDDDGVVEIVTGGSRWAPLATMSTLGIWSVSKVASSITVNLSSQSIIIGSQVTISGKVTDETDETPIPNAEVTIEYSRDPLPVFIRLTTVITNENGEYTFTWTPPAAGQYTIMTSWKGDFEHEGATCTTALTVKKASSLIALALSSYTAKVGDIISVSGILYPAKAATITIEYTTPEGAISTKTVNSSSVGVFGDALTADKVGEWTIKAGWAGDDVYEGTESALTTLMVTKIQSIISITASPLTVDLGENVTVSGTLKPAQTATITLTYIKPDGTTTTRTVVSTSAGTFTDTMKLDESGIWQVKASWGGNVQYEASESVPITVIAQAVDQTTPTFATVGLLLGAIALIVALIGVYMALKKKTSAPPPAPSGAPPPPPSPPAPSEAPPPPI
jgi:hypothetical protein